MRQFSTARQCSSRGRQIKDLASKICRFWLGLRRLINPTGTNHVTRADTRCVKCSTGAAIKRKLSLAPVTAGYAIRKNFAFTKRPRRTFSSIDYLYKLWIPAKKFKPENQPRLIKCYNRQPFQEVKIYIGKKMTLGNNFLT